MLQAQKPWDSGAGDISEGAVVFSFTPGSSGLKPSNMRSAYTKATPRVAEAPFARVQARLTPHAPYYRPSYPCSLPFRKASCLAQAQRTVSGTVRSSRTRTVSKSGRGCYAPAERTSQPGKKQEGAEAQAHEEDTVLSSYPRPPSKFHLQQMGWQLYKSGATP